jgi:hypothetical protein
MSATGILAPKTANRVRLLAVSPAIASAALLTCAASAAEPARICTPMVSAPVTVASPAQRNAAARKAEPPLTDIFAWPDTPLGVVRTDAGIQFFASDGGDHLRQAFRGHEVGNNKAGSIVTTTGTLDDPLGTAAPRDVSISRNPDRSVNPNFDSYGYMGGGPVYRVPAGMLGAGHLLATYHAELPDDALYPVLGLASSEDDGLHWMDLGEIVRFNQAYAAGLDGVEIGDGPLVPSPDGKYFYLYFTDWIANGTPHATTLTNVSVARALIGDVLQDAFSSHPRHAVTFQKFYAGTWILQPAIGGASSDLSPNSAYRGYIDIHYNTALQRYVMLISNDTEFAYAESIDALRWTRPVSIGRFGPIAAYPTAVGLGADPQILGRVFHVYFTHLGQDGWKSGALRRITLTCP